MPWMIADGAKVGGLVRIGRREYRTAPADPLGGDGDRGLLAASQRKFEERNRKDGSITKRESRVPGRNRGFRGFRGWVLMSGAGITIAVPVVGPPSACRPMSSPEQLLASPHQLLPKG